MRTRQINEEFEANTYNRTKSKKKIKKKHFGLKFILVFILFSAVVVLLALSPLFTIRQITVSGGQHYKQDDVIAVSGIIAGNNGFKTIGSDLNSIFLLRYGNSEKSILKNLPYVKDVVVKYAVPDKVRIILTERKPICVVPYLGTNLLMDEEGYIIDTVNQGAGNYNLPLVKGLEFQRFELGQVLKVENSENLQAVIKTFGAITDSDKSDKVKILGLIKWIDVSDLKKICLFVDARITVNIGDMQDLSYRISFLKQIYSRNLKPNDKGLLDFTTGENPNFIPEN